MESSWTWIFDNWFHLFRICSDVSRVVEVQSDSLDTQAENGRWDWILWWRRLSWESWRQTGLSVDPWGDSRGDWRGPNIQNTLNIYPNTCRCCIYTCHARFLRKKNPLQKNTDWFFDLKKVSFSDLYLGVGCCCLLVRSNQTELYKVESEPSERTITLNSSIWLHLDYAVSEKKLCTSSYATVSVLAAQSSFGMLAVLEEDTLFSYSTRVNKWPWASEKSIKSASANACLLGC